MKAKRNNADAAIPIVFIGGAKAFHSRSVFVIGDVVISIVQRQRRTRGGNLSLQQFAPKKK